MNGGGLAHDKFIEFVPRVLAFLSVLQIQRVFAPNQPFGSGGVRNLDLFEKAVVVLRDHITGERPPNVQKIHITLLILMRSGRNQRRRLIKPVSNVELSASQ